MGIPLLAGRTLIPEPARGGVKEVVVNRALVEQHWPGQDGLGKHLRPNSADASWSAVIVGVAENVRQWGAEFKPLPEIYFPYDSEPAVGAKLVVHSAAEPALLVPTLQKEIARLDPDMPLSNVRTMQHVFVASMAHRKFIMLLIQSFMAITLLLALVGVYGIMSYHAAQRIREFGLRLVFGASPTNIQCLVLRQALRIGGWGTLFGLIGTLNLSFVLRHLVYGVNALDALALVLGAVLILVAALLAASLPARRAARIDLMEALRYE